MVKKVVPQLHLVVLPCLLMATAGSCDAPRLRSFTIAVRSVIKDLLEGSKRVCVWVPCPAGDKYQDISEVEINVPADTQATRDREYGNHIIYFALTDPIGKTMPMNFLFTVTRKEHFGNMTPDAKRRLPKEKEKVLRRCLHPDRLVPVSGEVKELSDKVVADKTDALGKARAIYNYVIEHMVYDKSGTGWGRGDTKYACEVGKGNCSDYHSLFISLARAQGIPARFEIGFPLPERRGEGRIGGYHCWAEFYVEGLGWIPVDASEADKNPAKVDYYFGTHDENRVLFSMGRDITLSPKQKGEPLNYFIYPYVEVDGKPYTAVDTEVVFQDAPEK